VRYTHPTNRTATRSPLSHLSVALYGLGSSLCVIVGAVSLNDASDGTQTWFNLYYSMQTRPNPGCPGPWHVLGWGDTGVTLVTAFTIALLCAVVYAGGSPRRLISGIGLVAALLALAASFLLWTDTWMLGRTPYTDCDGAGIGGWASGALDRAGFLFLVAVVLCILAMRALNARLSEGRTGVPEPWPTWGAPRHW